MHDLKERTAYLKGLVEGVDFLNDEKQKVVWEGVINFCDAVAEELTELNNSQNEFEEYIEAIDEDLESLEKVLYCNDEQDEDLEVVFSKKDDDQNVMELTCPNCREDLYFEDQQGDYEIVCPECGKVVWNNTITNGNTKTDVI